MSIATKRNPMGKNLGHDARIVVESHYYYVIEKEGKKNHRKEINLLADVRLSFDTFEGDQKKFRADAFRVQAALIKAYSHHPDGELQSRIEFETSYIEGGYY